MNASMKTILSFLLLSLLVSHGACAEGALAIALPKNVAKQGFAAGVSTNYATREEAEQGALERCQNEKSSPKATRKLCRVIETFRDRCAAIALDPKAGTPGAGWAISSTKSNAESDAIAACEKTAGRARRSFCKVTAVRCDGTAE